MTKYSSASNLIPARSNTSISSTPTKFLSWPSRVMLISMIMSGSVTISSSASVPSLQLPVNSMFQSGMRPSGSSPSAGPDAGATVTSFEVLSIIFPPSMIVSVTV